MEPGVVRRREGFILQNLLQENILFCKKKQDI